MRSEYSSTLPVGVRNTCRTIALVCVTALAGPFNANV